MYKKQDMMTDPGVLAVYFLSRKSLEEPFHAYGIRWEERETEELISFVKAAAREMRRRGISLAAPSQNVRITQTFRVFIGNKELKIRPMAKSVLILFLRHPEGIALKSIADHEKELNWIYRRVSRSSSPEEIASRVSRILDLFNNDLNVNIARVNHALATLVDDTDLYRITGDAGKPKRIPLDRKWVIWEA